jgi:glycosyltransferase involved in cell wall biosynthesis
MTTITAALVVYNEEDRIENTLRTLRWCDEIVVVDKQSVDATRTIARRYTDRVIEAPYSDFAAHELQLLVENSSSEWLLWLTASDMVSTTLGRDLRRLVDEDPPYDVIMVPYRRFVLGLETKYSPWHGPWHPSVMRRSAVRIRTDDVHGAISYASTARVGTLGFSEGAALYHLTHVSVDAMMERHIRYTRRQAELPATPVPLRRSARGLIAALYRVIVKKRSFMMGWDGIALALAYMDYGILQFLYAWQRRRGDAREKYRSIREQLLAEWQEETKSA